MKELTESTIDGSGNFQVKIRKNETSESLIKRFLKKTKKEKILDELFDRKFFKKGTTLKREKKLKKESVIKKVKEKELLDRQLDE